MSTDQTDDRCPNCEAPLCGPFCSECGQHQVDLDRPIREIVTEGLSTLAAFDTRIGRTLWPLVRRPGFLTIEFLAGRRARFVHPFKLYFAFSLVFFLVFSYSDYTIIHANEPGIVSIMTLESEATGEANQIGIEGARDPSIGVDDASTDWISEYFAPLEEIAANEPTRFNRLFIDRLSKSLIILVPMVTVLLQCLYWRPRFVAHLVFALHVHSFSFLVLVVGAGVDNAAEVVGSNSGGMGNSIATLAIAVYVFLALRRVYGQGRLVTMLKFIVLVIGYCLALVITMLATLIITVAAL